MLTKERALGKQGGTCSGEHPGLEGDTRTAVGVGYSQHPLGLPIERTALGHALLGQYILLPAQGERMLLWFEELTTHNCH